MFLKVDEECLPVVVDAGVIDIDGKIKDRQRSSNCICFGLMFGIFSMGVFYPDFRYFLK